jgi:hypothetical protein
MGESLKDPESLVHEIIRLCEENERLKRLLRKANDGLSKGEGIGLSYYMSKEDGAAIDAIIG